MTHKSSNSIVAPVSAVMPPTSKGGETSTTSAPAMLRPARPRSSACASRVVSPPIYGVPVPGAMAGSMLSMSKVT